MNNDGSVVVVLNFFSLVRSKERKMKTLSSSFVLLVLLLPIFLIPRLEELFPQGVGGLGSCFANCAAMINACYEKAGYRLRHTTTEKPGTGTGTESGSSQQQQQSEEQQTREAPGADETIPEAVRLCHEEFNKCEGNCAWAIFMPFM